MLELQTCPACKAQSSASARECSRCGQSFGSRSSLLPVALIVILLAGGMGFVWSQGYLTPAAGPAGSGDEFGALTATADAPLRTDLEALSDDFRLPVEMTRAIAWSWTTAIRRNHTKHERNDIISAVAYSVKSHGVRGSLPSYFEEYWALADRGLDARAIRQTLRAQMFRGK